MNLYIKSATIIDPSSDYNSKTLDLLIENGVITKIGARLNNSKNYKELSKPNLHLSPGWFDAGVSFGEPGFEERETIENGLKTAAKSGFTSVVLNTNTKPIAQSGADLSFIHSKARNSATTLLPQGALTKDSEGKRLAELYDMHQEGAVAFYDYKKPVNEANVLKISLQYAKNFDGLVASFPFDTSVAQAGVMHEGEMSTRLGLKGLPAFSEELRVARDLYIAEYTNGKLHIPCISTAGSVALIGEAKKKGIDVSCSVTIHNLFFTDEALATFDSKFKVLPPLRTQKDIEALQAGLKNGTIDMVTTDHNPLDIEQKKKEFDFAAFGTIGLESAFGALNTLFTVKQSVKFLTKGKERFGLKKTTIAEGERLDATFFNPSESYVFTNEYIHSKSKNSIFTGSNLKGSVYGIFNNNKLVLND